MKVFGIGLARTGTASLNAALSSLGFRAEHFPRTYETILHNDCLTDTSVTVGYKYLDFMFPGSRFVLTTRSMGPWLESMRALFEHLQEVGIADRYQRLHYALYGTTVFDEAQLRHAYQRHVEDVVDYFTGRSELLSLDVTTSAPYLELGNFLDREVPSDRFPHLNDRAQMALSQPAFDH